MIHVEYCDNLGRKVLSKAFELLIFLNFIAYTVAYKVCYDHLV